MKRTVAVILLLVAATGVWLFFARTADEGATHASPIPGTTPRSLRPALPAAPTAAEAVERSTLADELNAPTSDINRDLRLVSELIDTFRTNFLQTGNPTGTNADITAALTGRNPLRLAIVPPDHSSINRSGELCDRWGTPFFFHAESATRMEIRSAGPDKKMWTDDDVAFAP